MPKFSKKSSDKLKTSHQDLQILFEYVVQYFDCTIVYGHRTPEEQFELYKKGRKEIYSKWVIKDKKKVVTYKDGKEKLSKHNEYPSLAVDVTPYPTMYSDMNTIRHFVGFVLGVARVLKSYGQVENEIISGIDWDGDNDLTDQNFFDACHFQIK